MQNVKGRKWSKNNVVNSIIHNETARVQIKICWVNSISKLQLCFLKRLLPWRGHLCCSNLTGPHPTSCCWCSYEERWIQWIRITALQADVRFPNNAVTLSAHAVITSIRCGVQLLGFGDQIHLCSQKADCVLITQWQVSFQSFHTLASVLPPWQVSFHTSKCMCTLTSVLTVQQQTVSRHLQKSSYTCKCRYTLARVKSPCTLNK